MSSTFLTAASLRALDAGASPAVMPIGGRACWRKEDILKNPCWGVQLTEDELEEIDRALKYSKTAVPPIEWEEDGVSRIPLNVSSANFPLDKLAKRIESLSEELEHGSGAVMVANMPVEKYSLEELGVIYLGMASYMGHIVLQSSSGLRSKSRGFGMPLGFIRAEMIGKTPLGGKQSNNYFRLHTDRCDVISLLGVRTASAGGFARVASAVAIHDEMVRRAPHLVPKLYQPIDRIWEGGKGVIALPVWDKLADGRLTTQLSPSYIENAQYVNGVAPLDADTVEAIDLVEEIGIELGVEFLQTPGMMTFLNNHSVYHGRTAWKHDDAPESRDGLDNGRLLLRAWVSPFNSRPLPGDGPHGAAYEEMWGSTEGGVPRGGLEPAIRVGLATKPKELVEAYATGRADYYGLYKRSFAGEEVHFGDHPVGATPPTMKALGEEKALSDEASSDASSPPRE